MGYEYMENYGYDRRDYPEEDYGYDQRRGDYRRRHAYPGRTPGAPGYREIPSGDRQNYADGRRGYVHPIWGHPEDTGRGFLLGIGVALLGYAFWPAVSNVLRPMELNAVQGAFNLTEQARSFVMRAKEHLEDIVAEAQFQNLQQDIGSDVDGVQMEFEEPNQ